MTGGFPGAAASKKCSRSNFLRERGAAYFPYFTRVFPLYSHLLSSFQACCHSNYRVEATMHSTAEAANQERGKDQVWRFFFSSSSLVLCFSFYCFCRGICFSVFCLAPARMCICLPRMVRLLEMFLHPNRETPLQNVAKKTPRLYRDTTLWTLGIFPKGSCLLTMVPFHKTTLLLECDHTFWEKVLEANDCLPRNPLKVGTKGACPGRKGRFKHTFSSDFLDICRIYSQAKHVQLNILPEFQNCSWLFMLCKKHSTVV